MDMKLARVTLGLAVLAFNAPLASASTTEYTDVLSFGAAVLPPSTYNFEGIAPSASYSQSDATVGGVTFTTATSNSGYVVDGSAGWASYNASFFSGQSLNPGTDPSEVVCTLSGATAIGFTYGDYQDGALPFTVTLSTGDSFTLTTPSNPGVDTGFVGFVSDTPITKVTFADSGIAFDVVGLSESSATSVPEPGTLALMATGMFGIALLRRQRSVRIKA
jgi:hypothetical protein